jgi:tRNA 2-(methylsulfanyl)-N6-isopentenyladenosine37 hydroxylase
MTPSGFLKCVTPAVWLNAASAGIDTVLIDHANCEKKAAGSALSLMYRYIEHAPLLSRLSRLAREELRHFEQVLSIMQQRGVVYRHVPPSAYAGDLRRLIRTHEPARLVDILVVCAIVEARSCERFGALAPLLDDDLRRFYEDLQISEARHFEIYLQLARQHAQEDLAARIELFLTLEATLINRPDRDLRFHSGVPG